MSVREKLATAENKLRELVFKRFILEKEITEEFIKDISSTLKEEIIKDESGIFKVIFSNDKHVDDFVNELIEDTKKELGLTNLQKNLKLPLDRIVVGQFVSWKAIRHFKSWECPCVITKVDLEKETFDIRTFDTFKETTDISFYVTEDKSEFSLCDKDVIINYLLVQNSELLKKKVDLELEIHNIEYKINERNSYILTLKDKVK